MPEYIDANSIELDPEEESNIFEAGSFELDEEEPEYKEPVAPKAPEPSMMDRAASFGKGLAHTGRAMAEVGAGLATGLAAFPISKGTKWIEYGLSGGDLDKAKAAEQRANELIQFQPTTDEARGAMEQLGKYVFEPVFGTLNKVGREAIPTALAGMGAIPPAMADSPALQEASGDIAEIGFPLAVGKLRGIRGAKEAAKVREELPVEKPVAEAVPERPMERPADIVPEIPKERVAPEETAKIVPAESVKLDEVVAEKPVAEPIPEAKVEPLSPEIVQPGANVEGKPIEPESVYSEAETFGLVNPETEIARGVLSKKDMTPSGELPGTTLSFMGMQGLYEGAVKTMQDISATTSQIIENTKVKPEIKQGVQSAKNAMIEHDRNIRSAEFTSKQLEKIVKDVVPKADRQMLMTHAYEQKMKGKAWDQLTDIEKGVVKWAAKEKKKLNDYIKENDILDMMESEDVNHIFHHWIDPKTGEPYAPVYGKFSKGLPQAKQRTIPTYEEGIKQGLTPATTNIGKLIGLEWEAATRANNARQLVKTLHGVKGDPEMSITLRRGAEPKPIRMVERWDLLQKQGLSEDYVRYESPFLDKAITFKTSDGTLKQIQGAVGVQKELYPFVKAYVENPNYGNLSQLNFASKSMKLGVSMFHVVSLGMQELANLRTPFVHIPKGLKLAKELGPTVKLLHQEGLEMFKGYEDLGYKNKFFKGDTELGRMGNAVTAPIGKIRDFIFNVVQPGMKISFADMQLRKLLPEYLKQAGEKITAEEVLARVEKGLPVPDAALKCAREVVQKSDGHFSGEHYKRSLLETNRFMAKLYFSPEARKWWQTALLSPTWQREHLLVAKNVAKSVMPDSMIKKLGLQEMGPIKSQYRKYALGGTMIVGAVDMWNQMATYEMDGESKHIWENPQGKGFAVRAWWNEPDYQITDKNGKKRTIKGGPAYIRPLKSLFEVAEWSHDPFRKVSYKLSPMVTAIGEQIWGNRGYGAIESIPTRAWDFITDVSTPIVFDQALSVAQGKRSHQGAVTSFFGMPSSKGKYEKGKIPPKPPY